MKVINLDYYTKLLVKDDDVLPLISSLLKAKKISDKEVSDVTFTVEEAPDFSKKIAEEAEQYKRWWLEEKEKVRKLEESKNA